MMKFSLIIGTLNRLESLKICLNSIFKQTYSDYEIIIIDQSENDDTEKYIGSIKCDNIVYRHVEFRGLSRARNQALKLAKGEYFCLIDDDACYKNDYLQNASNNCGYDKILSGYIYDTEKNADYVSYKNKNKKHKMSLREIMRTCPSASLVFPMDLINKCGYFDERFGVGAEFGAGEETDLLLRGIANGFGVEFVPNMKLKHPVPAKNFYSENIEKRAKYYEGLGALYKKQMIIEKRKELRLCYAEIWIKFYIKKIIFFKYNVNNTNKMIAGFKKGYRNWIRN